MVWVAKRINLLVCYIMITRERYLGRPMSIMSLPTPQGRQKTQANHTCFLGILSSIIDRQDKDISTQNNVTNLRQCTALLSCLGQDERWGAKNDWKVSSSRIMNYCDGPFSFQMKLSSLSPSEGVPDPEVPWDCTANTGIPADFPRPKHVKRTTEQSQLTKEKWQAHQFICI